jgi:hypothetical protein
MSLPRPQPRSFSKTPYFDRNKWVEGDVSHFVDHDQWDEAEAPELGLEVAEALGVREPGDPVGGGRRE